MYSYQPKIFVLTINLIQLCQERLSMKHTRK